MVRGTRAVVMRGAGRVLQPYLLDFANYTENLGGTDSTTGREFSVVRGCLCEGMRVKIRTSPPATTDLRLYRVSDQALIASADAVGLSVGEQELLFDVAVELEASGVYRLAVYDVSTRCVMYRSAEDHPDGDVVTLTSNCLVWSSSGDGYPSNQNSALSMAMEPIIYA